MHTNHSFVRLRHTLLCRSKDGMLAIANPYPQKPFPFLRLPKEIQLEVLKWTDLVDNRHGNCDQAALWIQEDGRFTVYNPLAEVEGKYLCPYRCETCEPHSGTINPSLLYVSKQLYPDALEILLRHNRIVLGNSHDCSLEYLKSLPPHLRRGIRHLHLQFHEDKDFDHDEDNRYCCVISNPEGWDRLIAWIANNLNLSILHLTIDLGASFPEIEDPDGTFFTSVDRAMFTRAYMRIAFPLVKLRGLYRCFVFLACNFEMEAGMERIAVGDAYSSLEYYKVPPDSRHFDVPHAWPPTNIPSEEASSLGWGVKDRCDELDPTHETVEMIESRCLHPEWWIDLHHFLHLLRSDEPGSTFERYTFLASIIRDLDCL